MGSKQERKNRRPASLRGAGLFLLTLLLQLPLGCGSPPEAPEDPELEGARELGLMRGARLFRVILGGRGSEEHVLPGRVRAVPGDAVEFVTVDHRVHVLDFPSDSLPQELRSFVEGAGLRAIPPLLSRGSRFVILLEDAPEGRYPFLSSGHGGSARGVIEVTEARDSLAPGPP